MTELICICFESSRAGSQIFQQKTKVVFVLFITLETLKEHELLGPVDRSACKFSHSYPCSFKTNMFKGLFVLHLNVEVFLVLTLLIFLG